MANNGRKVDTTHTELATTEGMRRRIFRHSNAGGRLEAADRLVKITDQQFYMLVYKIPTIFNDVAPNPSWLLWNFGFRLEDDGSVWVVAEAGMKSPVICDLRAYWTGLPTRHGPIKGRIVAQRVRHNVVQYAESERGGIIRMAQESLMREIARANESIQERMVAAEQRYKEGVKKCEALALKYGRRMTATEAEGLTYQRILNCQAALRTAKESMDVTMRCVCLFEMNECQEIVHLVEALQESIVASEATLKAIKEVTV